VALALAAPEVVGARPPLALTAPLSFRVAGVMPEAGDLAQSDRFVAEVAGACAGKRIVLTGHTCNLGPEVQNLALGRARASHVRDLLLAAGVREAIEIRSAGSAEPIESNATEGGRQHNRRVTATCSEEVK
jgi:flagellar motor protein MotB